MCRNSKSKRRLCCRLILPRKRCARYTILWRILTSQQLKGCLFSKVIFFSCNSGMEIQALVRSWIFFLFSFFFFYKSVFENCLLKFLDKNPPKSSVRDLWTYSWFSSFCLLVHCNSPSFLFTGNSIQVSLFPKILRNLENIMAFFFFFTNIALFLITQITNGIRSFEWFFF